MKRIILTTVLVLALGACQSTNPDDYKANPDCIQRKAGSKLASKLTSVGLGLAGVPGGGVVARGVSYATDPRCQAFELTPEASKRLARPQNTERS